jgi:hypothetical protein
LRADVARIAIVDKRLRVLRSTPTDSWLSILLMAIERNPLGR